MIRARQPIFGCAWSTHCLFVPLPEFDGPLRETHLLYFNTKATWNIPVNPDLSIIIPAHNEQQYMTGCLQSLHGLAQIAYEIIVVDSASNDRTVEISKEMGAEVIELKEKTFPGIGRNIGAKAAKGRVLAFIDADVVVSSQWIARVEQLVKDEDGPLVDSIVGDTYQNSMEESAIEKYWFTEMRKNQKSYINGGNILITKKNYAEMNGFSEHLETGEDVDFCDRGRDQGLHLVLDEELYAHHEGNPKNFVRFMNRERWHGIGDLNTFNHFFNSKVAMLSALFGLGHILFAVFLLVEAYQMAAWAFVLTVSICVFSSVFKFYKSGIETVGYNALVYYFYFLGRSLSILDRCTK